METEKFMASHAPQSKLIALTATARSAHEPAWLLPGRQRQPAAAALMHGELRGGCGGLSGKVTHSSNAP